MFVFPLFSPAFSSSGLCYAYVFFCSGHETVVHPNAIELFGDFKKNVLKKIINYKIFLKIGRTQDNSPKL